MSVLKSSPLSAKPLQVKFDVRAQSQIQMCTTRSSQTSGAHRPVRGNGLGLRWVAEEQGVTREQTASGHLGHRDYCSRKQGILR